MQDQVAYLPSSPGDPVTKSYVVRPASSVLNTPPLLGDGNTFLLYCLNSSFPLIANEPFLKVETVRV